MQQTKMLIKILHKLGIDDPDDIAFFTPTVQFIIWILLGIGVLIVVYEFWKRSQRLNYNETYTKIYKVVFALAGGILFLICVCFAFAAIDSPIANSLQSAGLYAVAPILILFGLFFILSIYDELKRTHDDFGEEIERKTWEKVALGISYAFTGVLLIGAGIYLLGHDLGDVSPVVNTPAGIPTTPVNPADAENYFDLGNKYHDNGEYEKAIDAYKKYIAENPQSSAAYYNLGLAYGKMNDHARAADAFRRATELDPQNADAYYNLGLAYGKMENYAGAVDAFRRATELDPQNADAYYYLGLAYENMENYTGATDAFRRAIELDSQNADAYQNLGLVYINTGNYASAIDAFRRATEINPQNADAYGNLGVAYGNMNDHVSAADAFRRAIEINPQNDKSYYNLAWAFINLERYNEALQSLNRAIEINPSNNDYRDIRDKLVNFMNGR